MRFFARQSRSANRSRSLGQTRRIRFEALESRQLLAVLAGSMQGAAERHVRNHSINGGHFEFTWDPAAATAADTAQGAAPAAASAMYPLDSIPQLHSSPGAAASVYLDFDGHFDASWGSYSNITTPVFDQDNDLTTFSDGELTSMHDIWKVVAEDYAPFNIDVTTVEPPSFANGVALRVAIGGDGAWTGDMYGGVAYVGSFTNSIVNTAYVFPDNLSNGHFRYTGEASSHEAGHAFGLQHQSQYDASGNLVAEYYGGPGDGRAPIMGSSYYTTRGLWWYGTTLGPNTYQDDLAVLSNATNGFGYRADDYPSTTALGLVGRDISGGGIIERTADQDAFSFAAVAGEMNLSVDVQSGIGNLNARLELRDAQGNLLAASDPATFSTRRTITYAAAGGNYTLVVASHGGYGDVGQYTLSGTIAVPSTIATPTNLAAAVASASQIDLSWIDNADNEDGYHVDRSTNLGQTWTRLTTLPLPANSNTFSDTTVAPGATLYYRVSAFNSGDVSAYSAQAITSTVPAVPGTLTATGIWNDRVYLKWGNVTGETGYKIERSTDGGGVWSQIAALGVNATNYQDAGLQTASTYAYRVRATNAGGDSPYTNQASATTLVAPPTAFGPEEGAYIVESWSGTYNDLAILPGSQQILTGGTKYSTDPQAPSDHRMSVARYNSSGSIDTTYGNGGLSAPVLGTSLEYGYGLVIQPDGKAVVAGLANSMHAVARFNSNGSLDTSFGNGGWNTVDVRPDDFYPLAHAVGLQSTGKIVIAGISWSTSPTDPAVLARFTTNGVVDSGGGGFGQPTTGYSLSTFGEANSSYFDVAIQTDNKIVAVGQQYAEDGTNRRLVVARFTANGTLDTTFNGSGFTVLQAAGISESSGSAITLQADGKIVVAGYGTGIDGSADMLIARFNSSGTLDTTFAGGAGHLRLDIDGVASQTAEFSRDLVIQPNGKIIVAGTLAAGPNPSDILVARLNADGTTDATFGAGGFKVGSLPAGMGSQSLSVGRVALLADGTIIVSGYGNWSPPASGQAFYHPLLMRFAGDPTAVVTPTSGLITTEAGGQAAFTVSLSTQPTADVVMPVSSSDTTEGTVSTASLTFTAENWNIPQTVTITGVDDAAFDGSIAYFVVLGAASSADARYAGLDPSDVSVANTDNDAPVTKFYVVNDASSNLTYEYDAAGAPVENYSLNGGNTAPRGAASTIAGDRVWVVDNNRKVYVYNASGGLLGSWTAGTLAFNASPQGIATNGTDIWIVDSRSDKVFKYTGAASRLSGSQSAASSFNLNGSNSSPSDIVTDGASLWVLNDASTNKVFKYTIAGALLGSWTIDPANATPTGITIDPSNVSTIWIVDSGTDRIYEYTAAATRTSGSQTAAASFALAAGNTNPQGLADPPPSAQRVDAVFALDTEAALDPIDVQALARVSTEVQDHALLTLWAGFEPDVSRVNQRKLSWSV